MAQRKQQRVLFPELLDKPVSVEFTQPTQTSDGGVILLKALDQRMGLTRSMTMAIRDPRQRGKIVHELWTLVQQRVFAIACGYPDQDHAARLAQDPALKLVCERRDGTLASQATLSRLENAVRRVDLLRMAYSLTDTVIECERQKRGGCRVRRIVIDMDSTADPTYGDQQLTFFNAYYDDWCYQPMLTTVSFDEDPEQFQVAPVLRPGNAKGSAGATAILKRLVPRLRRVFPRAKIYVRMDGAFATPQVLAWLEANDLGYVVNMGKNSVLEAKAEPLMKEVRRAAKESGRTSTQFGEARYKAGKWKHERRAVIKAEVTVLEGREPRDNPRFVITNLAWSPKKVYRFYAMRGDMENRIKELHDGLRFDLTSCPSFLANQFRNLRTAAAYALYQQLRQVARRTECVRAQVWTLRERLIKIGVRIKESVRRIVVEAPESFPGYRVWRELAMRLGASP